MASKTSFLNRLVLEKKNIVFVIDYNQEYLIPFVSCVYNEANLYFLNYAYQDQIKTNSFSKYGTIIFWKDFKNAYDLIENLSISKVVFFELETLNQVALNVACKERRVKTVFCDHGLQDIRINKKNKNRTNVKGQLNIISKLKKVLKSNPLSVWKTRCFYNNTIKQSSESASLFLKEYKRIRLSNNIYYTYEKINNSLLFPENYYCFSAQNYEYHRELNKDTNIKVYYFGIPEYDSFVNFEDNPDKKHILYIDQPYCHFGYYGWHEDLKITWLNNLSSICKKNKLTLFIKKHPRETSKIWNNLNKENICFVDGNLEEAINKSLFVLGFNSTMLLPIAALDFTSLICIKTHPDGSVNETDIFVSGGVASWVNDLDELNSIIKEIPKIKSNQHKNKSRFISRWLYKFDGNSGSRLRDLYLNQ